MFLHYPLHILHFTLSSPLFNTYTFGKIEKIRRMPSQVNRLQTVVRRQRKRAPFIEELPLSAQETKKKKKKIEENEIL